MIIISRFGAEAETSHRLGLEVESDSSGGSRSPRGLDISFILLLYAYSYVQTDTSKASSSRHNRWRYSKRSIGSNTTSRIYPSARIPYYRGPREPLSSEHLCFRVRWNLPRTRSRGLPRTSRPVGTPNLRHSSQGRKAANGVPVLQRDLELSPDVAASSADSESRASFKRMESPPRR